ncbi:MAG TPA: VCBS repeat-containing protein, partial [Candidatus Bathyarchaeia archaeon]|nr:VCBS repeat-containing protein [Candidatus Bathyarchaeia archaeon]
YQQSGNTNNSREHLKKFQYIKDNRLGAPISLTYGEQGQYSRAEESAGVVEKVPPQIPVRFVDVTKEAGLTLNGNPSASTGDERLSSLGTGACFLDYDGDGKVDIFFADNGSKGGTSLYRNLGAGKFEDVTKQAGFDPNSHAVSCTAGDYDNDGYVDLAVGTVKGIVLYHNEKNGTFRNTTREASIQAEGFVMGLTFVDYDHDGDLDLFFASWSSRPTLRTIPGEPKGNYKNSTGHSMFRNNGDGTFTDVTEQTGLDADPGIGVLSTDYNNDRAVDLVVSDFGVPHIFVNPREGKFLKIEPWLDQFPNSPPVAVVAFDFNHDGWMDIAFSHWYRPGITLWRNNKAKSFERVDLPPTDWVRAFGVTAIDYDNDGWVDLVAVGETKDGKGEVRLFRNLGPDGWKDVTVDVGLDKIQLKEPRAIIAGDYDNDGA